MSTGAGAGLPGDQVEGDWAGEQMALYEAYVARRARAERRPVKILWWRAAVGKRPDVVGVLSRLWSAGRSRADEDLLFVALYDAADPVGARPFLVVRARPDSLDGRRGRSIATAVGRVEPGGALVIETRRGVVLPAEPPGLPGDDALVWSEVDAAG